MLFLSFHVFLSLLIFEVEKAGCVSEFVPLLHRELFPCASGELPFNTEGGVGDVAPLGKRFDHGGHLRGPSLRRHVFSLVKGDKKNPTLTGSKHSGFDTEVWRVWCPSLGLPEPQTELRQRHAGTPGTRLRAFPELVGDSGCPHTELRSSEESRDQEPVQLRNRAPGISHVLPPSHS